MVSGLNSRIYDYTPFEDSSWQRKTGGASQYLNYLKHTVVPYIKAHYRTIQKSTLVGNSLGGLFAAFTLFTEPSLFSSYIIGSPSVWFKENSILAMAVKPAANTTNLFVIPQARHATAFPTTITQALDWIYQVNTNPQ